MKTITIPRDIISSSGDYARMHGVTDADQDTAARIKAAIEARPSDIPKAGDVVICVNPKTGRRHNNGHLEDPPGPDAWSNICTGPMIPFVFLREDGSIHTDTSGGYWKSAKSIDDLKPTGEKREKMFCTWGHCGMCAAGAFHFRALVDVWIYSSTEIY